MKKNDVYGYIRVSDTKQIDGASLSEQERAIIEYAKKNNLTIIKWFEETKTAAKRGRPKFTEMLKLLKSGEAGGVIMHKIDRSARNLHDWASVGDLIDNGIQVHFAHESLDMTERGGRLSADIQAVMASDYVRNLRQETIKGIYGRLNQGIYPFGAPIGYLNQGKGKFKKVDSKKYLLVIKLFEMYASGNYNASSLGEIIYQKGLRNHKGNRIDRNAILSILKNPFYAGIIKVKDKLYPGGHEPIISLQLFNKVQEVIKPRKKRSGIKHDYLFRKLIKCGLCNYFMPAEKQKGNVYYRCQTTDCLTKTRREDFIEKTLVSHFKSTTFSNTEIKLLKEVIEELKIVNKPNDFKSQIKKKEFDIAKLKIKKDKLLEAYLDTVIDETTFTSKKNIIIKSIALLEEDINSFKTPKQSFNEKIENFLELSKSLLKSYNLSNNIEKRNLLNIIASNFTISEKSFGFTMLSPFSELMNLSFYSVSVLSRDRSRTSNHKISQTDNNPLKFQIKVGNEKTTLINRPEMNKEQIKAFLKFLDINIQFIPNLQELYKSDTFLNNSLNNYREL